MAIIDSMTPAKRRFPKTINGSRKRRVAKGSGQQVQDINRPLKQHMQMLGLTQPKATIDIAAVLTTKEAFME